MLCYSLEDFRQNWLHEDHSQQEGNCEAETRAPVVKKGNRRSSLSWQQLKQQPGDFWNIVHLKSSSSDPSVTEQASRLRYFVWSARHTTSWQKRQNSMKKEISFSLKMTILMSFCLYHANMVFCLLYSSASCVKRSTQWIFPCAWLAIMMSCLCWHLLNVANVKWKRALTIKPRNMLFVLTLVNNFRVFQSILLFKRMHEYGKRINGSKL